MQNAPDSGAKEKPSIYAIRAYDIDGNSTPLSVFKGKVLLIVNVASKCGFTPQYAALQKLYETYKGRGFVVLGFPCNDFMWQEPGLESQIKQFCTVNYGVTFPLFSKIHVKGEDTHDLYKFLTAAATDPAYAGEITWNFNKFLIDRSGNIVGRFGSKTTPDDPAVIEAVEKALGGE
ncbi:MAG TPA: glutathione peroxidase [bacterium]|nr:glutathione peroxidase [bacterium]